MVSHLQASLGLLCENSALCRNSVRFAERWGYHAKTENACKCPRVSHFFLQSQTATRLSHGSRQKMCVLVLSKHFRVDDRLGSICNQVCGPDFKHGVLNRAPVE